MDAALILVAGAGGIVVGALTALLFVLLQRRRTDSPAGPRPTSAAVAQADLARRSLQLMQVGVVVLDAADQVVLSNQAARRMGVVRDNRVTHGALRTLARQVRRASDGGDVRRDTELDLPRGRAAEPLAVRVRVAQVGFGDHVVLQIEDITEAHRVQKVRRDFVANVSHELKTPVGALQLLAEAVLDATDDPEAVARFAARMTREASRLGTLIQEIIDLSRLQGADPLPEPKPVYVDQVVSEVLDRTRMGAESQDIVVVSGGESGLVVRGNEAQLVTAVTNLVDNAINYSPDHTRVAIGTRQRDGLVEISVSDQGIGIGETDLDRIFERFYRADPARSRATGGTGLGLAIVKHIATNHGGSVDVWSVEGSGSTFTLRLPSAARSAADDPAVADGSDLGPDPDPDAAAGTPAKAAKGTGKLASKGRA
ncbi:sensor histidine kinase [Fodinicola feengrottensis]|uniref:Sensor-like histidine kinase SenX3 n=1 Tax=Fodinicola feengrottensis TaxID=435914 RepID=A0ABN2I406_9ACTN|nr:ATP-binding protein [Fodinicola feengrottensis]